MEHGETYIETKVKVEGLVHELAAVTRTGAGMDAASSVGLVSVARSGSA
jgi:hypothetical protein